MQAINIGSKGQMKSAKPSIIAFGWNPWSDCWMPRQQYLSRFGARGWPVSYTAGSVFIWNWLAAVRARNTPVTARFRMTANVKVHQTGLLCPRWPGNPRYDRFATWNEVRQMRKAVKAENGEALAFITHPNFAAYLDHLDDLPVIYFAEDAFSLMPGFTEADHRREEQLVKRADLIVTCAASMAEQLPGDGPRRARILPNGVDYAAFSAPGAKNCPEDLAAIPEPRIGYTGSVNLKVDFGLIASIARRRPDLNWVLVGPVGIGGKDTLAAEDNIGASYRECRSLPNVHFLGSKPFYELPNYMSNMTVNTMCYRTDGNGWWKVIDPIKTNEYLASGKPVISADLVNVRPFSDCIQIARTEEEWMTALHRALTEDIFARVALGRERAKGNDWNLMTDEFELMMIELTDSQPVN